ncbi:unnamed protein product [Mytilus coruscus]|uniref:YqaJ viral recombinase domain-containing protein n=1 Tax=Mytilus coruscus TaxID=42192 RepID=A0A6J8CHE7_MYTCO|nr:unnamed protein product [Mytilus coruscus]
MRFLLINRNESKYEDIHRSLNTSLRFASFKETISYDQIYLVWTTAEVLPRYAMPSDKNILKKLKSIEEPSFEVVMQHAKNICSVLFHSCADHDETVLTTIIGRIYLYFLSRKERNVSELKVIPLIHIIKHKKFAYPSEVVKNINDSNEIPPYLLKAPIEYGQFFKFFNCLGMKDEPTVATYSKVLWKIHKKCSQSPLGPNEIIMVQKALHSFMRLIQQLEEPVDDLEVDELYLMSENNQLLPANELYYESLEIRRERLATEENLHFLADFRCIGINVVELPRLFDLIPERYRPLSVHSIVTENLAFHEFNESETASKLLEILTSETFINALLRICKHDQKIMSNELTIQDMQRISARLRRLRIFSVSKLETNLTSGQMEIEGTKSEKSCFYCNEKEIIYIHDQRLGVDTWLCRYGIELERMLRVVCYGKGGFKKSFWYPLPGSLVPREVHSRLRKPLEPIAVNQYAVIPCETDKTSYGKLRHFEDTFIYVIVTNTVFNSVETLQHYMVNVGKQDIKIDKDLILEIQPLGTHTETDVQSELYPDDTGIDELDSRTLHSAREFHVFRLPNPQKQMGWKWFTQAKYDLDAGYATLNGIDLRPFKGYNWICLQCQQAAEKAVKAAQYATDANEVQRSHFFSDNIPNGDKSLSTLCLELSTLVGHINSLRYPDNYSPIPAERYNRDGATKALCLTDQILTYISEKYFTDLKRLCIDANIKTDGVGRNSLEILLCFELNILTCGTSEKNDFCIKEPKIENHLLDRKQLIEFQQLSPNYLLKLPGWTKEVPDIDLDMSMVKKYLLNCQVSEYNQTSLRQYKLTRAYQHLDAKHLNNVSYNPIVNSDTFCATSTHQNHMVHFALVQLGAKVEPKKGEEIDIRNKPSSIKTYINDIAPKLSKERQYQRTLQLLYDIRNANSKDAMPPIVNIVDLARFRPVKQPEVKGPESLPETCSEFHHGICYAESITVETTPPSLTEIPHQHFQSIDDDGYQEGLNKYINLIQKTYNQTDRSKIETLTRGQSANEEWFRQRIGAITASKVVHVLGKKKNQNNFLMDIMKYKPIDLSRVKPIQWGLKHEITALKQVTKLYEATHTNLEIVQPGLLVDRTYSYLRASPDAIMTCDCHGTTVIEIKCPYSCRYLTPTVAVCEKKITYVGIEKENMVLVKGHQYGYYEQIQTQLNVCKENNAKLVVWTTKGLLTIDVPFDEKYWTTIMLPAIRSFFETHIAPEILTGRLKNSLVSQDNVKDKEKSDSSEDSTNESFSEEQDKNIHLECTNDYDDDEENDDAADDEDNDDAADDVNDEPIDQNLAGKECWGLKDCHDQSLKNDSSQNWNLGCASYCRDHKAPIYSTIKGELIACDAKYSMFLQYMVPFFL